MSKEMQEMMFLEISQSEFCNLLAKEGDTIKEICDCMCDMCAAKTEYFVNPGETAARLEDYSDRYAELMGKYELILLKERDFLDKFVDIYQKNYVKDEEESDNQVL